MSMQIIFKIQGGSFFILPVSVVVGQSLLLHVSVPDSLSVPSSVIDNENSSFDGHKDPPASGNGLSHNLTLERCPPPHVKEHPLRFPHGPQAPTAGDVISQYSSSIFIPKLRKTKCSCLLIIKQCQ